MLETRSSTTLQTKVCLRDELEDLLILGEVRNSHKR